MNRLIIFIHFKDMDFFSFFWKKIKHHSRYFKRYTVWYLSVGFEIVTLNGKYLSSA